MILVWLMAMAMRKNGQRHAELMREDGQGANKWRPRDGHGRTTSTSKDEPCHFQVIASPTGLVY